MDEITTEYTLNALLVLAIVMSVVLLLISTATLGRYAADLEYQALKNIRGIRYEQSWINIRTHTNRILLSIAYLTIAILSLLDFPADFRSWVGRILFIVVLIVFTISSVLDWIAERKQVEHLLEYSERNDVSGLRIKAHRLNNKLSIWLGMQQVEDEQDVGQGATRPYMSSEKTIIAKEAVEALKELQDAIREMDPSYKNE